MLNKLYDVIYNAEQNSPSESAAPFRALYLHNWCDSIVSDVQIEQKLNWCDAVAQHISTHLPSRLFQTGDNQLSSRWIRTLSSSPATAIAVRLTSIDKNGNVHHLCSLLPMIGKRQLVERLLHRLLWLCWLQTGSGSEVMSRFTQNCVARLVDFIRHHEYCVLCFLCFIVLSVHFLSFLSSCSTLMFVSSGFCMGLVALNKTMEWNTLWVNMPLYIRS